MQLEALMGRQRHRKHPSVHDPAQPPDAKVNELTASLSSMRDGVAACAAQSAHLQVVFQQIVDNHADRVLTSRDDGDTRDRLHQRRS